MLDRYLGGLLVHVPIVPRGRHDGRVGESGGEVDPAVGPAVRRGGHSGLHSQRLARASEWPVTAT
ncbi:hypothetical protein CU044_1825 [Streptomyces sp. L-9-10]|nr:hypothetical protein CU044_1825 [Streptomyces sp. L-9-10]